MGRYANEMTRQRRDTVAEPRFFTAAGDGGAPTFGKLSFRTRKVAEILSRNVSPECQL